MADPEFRLEKTDNDYQRGAADMRQAEVLQVVQEAERLKNPDQNQPASGDKDWIPIKDEDIRAWWFLTEVEKKSQKKWEEETAKNVKLVEGDAGEWNALATPHREQKIESEATIVRYNPIAANVIGDQRAIVAKHPEYDVEPMLPEMSFTMPDGQEVPRDVNESAGKTSHICTFIAQNTDERNQFRACIFDLLTANVCYKKIGSYGKGGDFSTRATWVDREGKTYKKIPRGGQMHGLVKRWLPYGIRIRPQDVIEDPWCGDPKAANHISHDFIKPIVEVENSPFYKNNKNLVDNLTEEDRRGGKYERIEVDGVKDRGYVKLREVEYRYPDETNESGFCVVVLTLIHGQDKTASNQKGGVRCVRHGKLPFDTGGEFTIKRAGMIRIPDDVKGFTFIRLYKYIVGDVNTLLSANLKWLLISVPRLLATEGLFSQRSGEKLEIGGMGEITMVDEEIKGKLERLPIDPPPPSVYDYAMALNRLGQELSGRSMNQRLQVGARTATESANVAGEVEAQRGDVVEIFKEFAGDCMKLKLKYFAYALPASDKEGKLRIFYLPDGSGGHIKFDLLDLLGDYNVRLNYQSTMWKDDAVLIHQAMEILNLILKLPPHELQRMDWKPILSQIFVSFGPSWHEVRRKMMSVNPAKDKTNPDTEHIAMMLGYQIAPSPDEDFSYTLSEHLGMFQRATNPQDPMSKLWKPETIQIFYNHIQDSKKMAQTKGQPIPKVLEDEVDERGVRDAMKMPEAGEPIVQGDGIGPDYNIAPGEVMTPPGGANQRGSGLGAGRLDQAPGGGVPTAGDLTGQGTAGLGRIT